MTTIIVTHEDNEVDEFEFEPDHNTISIGRRSSNDVCVPDLSISGNHARIVIAGSEAWLEDLESTNGSYVNGQVVKRMAINNGDDIILGKIRMAFIHTPVAEATTAAAQTMDASSREAESTPVLEAAGDGFDDSFAESSLAHDSAAVNAAEAATEKSASKVLDDDEMSFVEDARIFAQPPVESASHQKARLHPRLHLQQLPLLQRLLLQQRLQPPPTTIVRKPLTRWRVSNDWYHRSLHQTRSPMAHHQCISWITHRPAQKVRLSRSRMVRSQGRFCLSINQ